MHSVEMHSVADTGLTEDYIAKLHEEVSRLTEKLVNGHPKDYASYTELTGRIKGIRQAESILHDVIKQYMEMQDYD